MPPSDFQTDVLRLIAANRSPESHVAGGLALNMNFERLSDDVDLFHDAKEAMKAASDRDAEVLTTAGYEVIWTDDYATFRSARIVKGDGATKLDWAVDSSFRFFPPQPDPELGWRLHSFDLATNKALAAAARRAPRDAVDLVTVHERLYPLGCVVWAAVAKDPGFSPLSLLDWIGRFARYQDHDLRELSLDPPVSAADLSRRLKDAIRSAETFCETMPAEDAGAAYLMNGEPVQPDPSRLPDYLRRTASPGGVWPLVADS